MARLLGDRILPESVQSQRRRMRSRLQDLREPIRQRRVSMVPGPDIIGSIEDQLMGLRSRAVRREGFVSMMQNARQSESSSSNGNGSTSSSNSSDSSESSRGSSTDNTVTI